VGEHPARLAFIRPS